MECGCPHEGWCPRFRRRMSLRAWELCSRQCPQERPCPSPEVSEDYRRMWAAEASPWPWMRLLDFWRRLSLHHRVRRLLRFSRSALHHLMAGLPHATEEEQAARRNQCSRCPQFNQEKDECKECGCTLGAVEGQKKLVRKILWAGESCPLWRQAGPRPACQPMPPEGGWGPVKGVSIFRRLWRRLFS